MHLPLWHCRSDEQVCPMLRSGVHVSVLQYEPPAHSTWLVQDAGHVVSTPLQVYGSQVGVPGMPTVAGEQVPRLLATSHASQVPSQAPSQQWL